MELIKELLGRTSVNIIQLPYMISEQASQHINM
jgi:hypothetical protein